MSKAVDNILKLYSKLTDEQVIEFHKRFSGEPLDMEEYLTKVRFANGHVCPFCGSATVVKNGKGLTVCKDIGVKTVGSHLISVQTV